MGSASAPANAIDKISQDFFVFSLASERCRRIIRVLLNYL